MYSIISPCRPSSSLFPSSFIHSPDPVSLKQIPNVTQFYINVSFYVSKRYAHLKIFFCFFLFFTTLLGYNSNTVQFINLKYTLQWLLVYSLSFASITTICFRIFLLFPKETPCPLAITLQFPYSQDLGKHSSTLYLYRFAYSGNS